MAAIATAACHCNSCCLAPLKRELSKEPAVVQASTFFFFFFFFSPSSPSDFLAFLAFLGASSAACTHTCTHTIRDTGQLHSTITAAACFWGWAYCNTYPSNTQCCSPVAPLLQSRFCSFIDSDRDERSWMRRAYICILMASTASNQALSIWGRLSPSCLGQRRRNKLAATKEHSPQKRIPAVQLPAPPTETSTEKRARCTRTCHAHTHTCIHNTCLCA